MAKIKISKVTALPAQGSLTAHTMYLVSTGTDKMELYMTGSNTSTVRRLLNEVDIQALIDSSVNSLSGVEVVDDIAARDALTPSSNTQVLVIDASADSTVTSGSATYIYRQSDTSWNKISEGESMDIALAWNNISGKPTATAAEIDAAVSDKHTHSNKTQLDNIGQDADGDITYNGSKVANEYVSLGW